MQASLQGKYRERNNQIKIMFNVSIIILILVPLISCQTEVRLGMIKIRMAPSHLQEQIKVFSNYGDGLLTWGNEEVVTNYMELSEDPKGKRIRWSKPCHSFAQVTWLYPKPQAIKVVSCSVYFGHQRKCLTLDLY